MRHTAACHLLENDCQNTRHEILIRDISEPLRFKTSKNCKVIAGKWIGPYTGKTFITHFQQFLTYCPRLASAPCS